MTSETASKPASFLSRFWPLGLIAVLLGLFFAAGGQNYISLDYLKEQREALAALVSDHFIWAIIAFIALYALLVGISVPGASLLSIFGGFLFGTWFGAFGIVIGATLGASIIFWAARRAIGDTMTQKMGPYMKKFESGLKENELSYLFILRLVPIFPFFVVNVVPALFDVKFRNYFISTLFGIIPGAIVFASIGDGASAIFEKGGELSLSGVMLEPRVLFPIIGLILLSLIPVLYKKLKPANAA